MLQVLLVEAGLQSATAGLEGSEVCTHTCTCCPDCCSRSCNLYAPGRTLKGQIFSTPGIGLQHAAVCLALPE